MADQETSDGGANKPCEAGIFSLGPGGWVLLQRRAYPGMAAALRWMKSRTNTLAARHPELRFSASAVTLGGWLTLETVRADLEAKRKAGASDSRAGTPPTGKTP